MSYTFQVIFSGLCAFVPDTDIDKTAPSHIDVLLVDTDDSRTDDLKFDHYDDHFPILKYRAEDEPGGAAPLGDRDSRGFWTLREEHLVFDVRNNVTKVVSAKRPFSLGSISSLPRMDKVFPPANELDPGALLDNPNFVIARLVLDQGTLADFEIGKINDGDITAQFVPPPPSGVAVTQTLAIKVSLTLTLDDDEEVVFHSKDFNAMASTDPDVRSVVVGPKPGGTVQVSVMNLCCGYFMEKKKDNSEKPAQDTDFEYFYILAKDFDQFQDFTQLPIPVPVSYPAIPPVAGDGGGETARCNMVLFNGK